MNAKQAKEILENRFIEVKDEMLYEFLTDKEVFEALLISGISPNSSDNYFKKPILSLAYNKKVYNSFKLLLDYGADPNIETETEYSSEFKWPLIFSVVGYYAQYKSYFRKIIKHDVDFAVLDVNKNNSLLHICVLTSSPSVELAEFLLNKGVDPSLKNNDGVTALDIAQKRYESSSWSTELQEKFAAIMKLLKSNS